MPRAIFESLLIVFSVFLALGLNSWAEDQREAERLAEMRTYLVQEIRLNRDTLASDHWLPHHTRLRDAVMAVATSDPPRCFAHAQPWQLRCSAPCPGRAESR